MYGAQSKTGGSIAKLVKCGEDGGVDRGGGGDGESVGADDGVKGGLLKDLRKRYWTFSQEWFIKGLRRKERRCNG